MTPESLTSSISRLASWRKTVTRGQAAGASIACLIAGAGFLGWADMLADFSGFVRLAGVTMLLVGALAAGVRILVRARRDCSPRALAASMDRFARTGGLVTVGVELAEESGRYSDSVTHELAAAAAREAGRVAESLEPRRIHPLSSLRRPWAFAGATAAALALVALIWPAVFFNQALRLIDPLGDHPPYCPYRFHVTPGDAKVFFGDSFSVTARVLGEKQPKNIEWVIEPLDGRHSIFPMLDQGEQTHIGTIGVVEQPFEYFVRGPEGRSPRYRVSVVVAPRIDKLNVRIEYPAYTRRLPYKGAYPDGGIAGVAGTRVTMWAASNRPLREGRMTTTGKSPALELRPKQGDTRVVHGNFEIVEDAGFELSVTDVDGYACREPFRGKISLIPDRGPSVAILNPPAESYATPEAVIPVVIEAEDDFGIARAGLVRSLNGTHDHARPLDLPKEPSSLLRLTHPLELKDWQLEPGDVLEFYAVVADNDPRGEKTAESKVHRVRIISTEEFLKLLQARQRIEDILERYRPLADRLEALREEAKKLREAAQAMDDAASGSDEAKKAREQSEQALDRLREALAQAAKDVKDQAKEPPVFDIDKEFQKELDRLAKELDEAEALAREAKKNLSEGKSTKDALDRLARKLGEAEEGYDAEAMIPLEVLEKIYRLMEYEARFTALALAQDDLAKRVRRFGAKESVEDPQERAELMRLAEEQRRLEEELRDVIQGIRDQAARLPQGEPYDDLREQAEEFATAVTDAKAPEALNKALQSLRNRRGKQSQADTRAAADLLLSFVAQCEGNMGEQGTKGCLKFQPSLARAMSNTLQSLLGGLGLPRPGKGNAIGPGQMGSGGGSSAVPSMSRMGLYGPVPTRGGGLRGRPGGSGGLGAPSAAGGRPGDPSAWNPESDLLYGGVPIQVVPGEYRAAVRDFFRRVAEESGRDGR